MTNPIKRAGLVLGLVAAAIVAFFTFAVVAPHNAMAAEGKPHWILELKDGKVDIELLPEVAPLQVARIIELTNKGFYNGIVFHRVIDGFMAQSGDPTGTGMGGSDLPDLKAEFTDKLHFVRGTVGAARSSDPDSANSQFFIMFGDANWLDGQYTIFGQVTSGMDVVDKIKKGAGDQPVVDPDKIISATISYE